MNPSNRLAPVAVIALLSLPAAALAQSSQSTAVQSATPPAAAASPMAGHPVQGKNAEERVERRIKELHTQLRITPAEEPQWNQFAQVMRENARDMDEAFMQRAQHYPTLNAVQNMQSYEQIASEIGKAPHSAGLRPCFCAFYPLRCDCAARCICFSALARNT